MPIPHLRAESSDSAIRIYRGNESVPILEQQAPQGKRPYIHPLLAPDGHGVLTENAPPHHPWQHGIYVGLNDVNGIGFWEEGVHNNPKDGSFQPFPLKHAHTDGHQASWEVETLWLDPDGKPMLTEWQKWQLTDNGDTYSLDLTWTLQATVNLTFGKYAYGGLFLRMPYREAYGGEAINSEGQTNSEAEGKRARWVACSMPIAGRADQAGIAYLDHPHNPEHPVPWRVDYQLGISPSRCIARQWQLGQGDAQTSRYRIFVFCGSTESNEVERSWQEFAK